MDAEAKQYEISYVINGDLSEEDAFGIAGKITSLIQDERGMLGRIDEPKRRKLAYPIGKIMQGYVGCTTFTMHPDFVGKISEKLKREQNIIRCIVTGEVKRPIVTFRGRGERSGDGGPSKPFEPQAPREENPEMIAALDKKLDEIFGDEKAPEPAPAKPADGDEPREVAA